MKNTIILFVCLLNGVATFAQSKNFIDQPYLETSATVDTLVTPDRIHLEIVLSEEDSRNKKSTERLEADMIKVLKSIKIDLEEDLRLADFDSDYRKYFLSSKKVLKTKVYKLLVKDAFTLSKVLIGLEEEGISNVSITKTEYSKEDELLLDLKAKAILMAQSNANALVKPLNQKLLKAIRISDQSRFQYWSPMDSSLKMEAMNSMGNDKLSPIQNIEFQNIKFTTTVNVTFAIE